VKFEIRNVTRIFEEFFKVERSEVRWEQVSGAMGGFHTRYAIRRGDSVGIVPLLKAGEGAGEEEKIVLVQQFRYPVAKGSCDGYLWEIPAGMLHGGESPAETARRELREEIGLEVETVDPLVSFYLSPGVLDEMLHLFLARLPVGTPLETAGGNSEEHEDLRVKAFSLPELRGMIKGREIVDAKTVAAVLYYDKIR
jgi:nudix-type nucleoside diphosphatase (YffH/AdpP family)